MNDTSNDLKIYSASAGSGKTFSLTVEYVSKLLQNPRAYRSIVAVTFTNKATAEMKNRILSTLWAMVYSPQSVASEIKAIKGQTKAELSSMERTNAELALKYILHDYDRFWIETIDTFFQRVLRNMAKEIGVSSGFELVLSDSEYVETAIKEMKTAIEEDKDLKRCLDSLVSERISKGERWNYESEMTDFAKYLNKRVVEEGVEAGEIDQMLQETAVAKKKVSEFEKRVNGYLEEFFEICNSNNFTADNFKGKSRGSVYSRFAKFCNGNTYDVNTETDKIFKDREKEETELQSLNAKLYENYRNFRDFYEGSIQEIKALNVVYRSAYKLCLLKFISTRKQELLKEDNSFLLGQTQRLLNAMVTSEEVVPFIYEKIGSRISHIMIDEFQDTSTQAWRNFEFLLKECLSNGGSCALFGDIKQSIYRWNEGDWQILKELYDNPKKNRYNILTSQRPLSDNYRTDAEIVDFNNGLFEYAFPKVGIETIVAQNPQRNKGFGKIRLHFLDKETRNKERSGDDYVVDRTIEEIDYYLDKGFRMDDIVLLFRNKSKAQEVAERLRQADSLRADGAFYKPSSSDSFCLQTSTEVQKIIFLLRYISNRKDTVAKYWLENIGGLDCENLSLTDHVPNASLMDLVLELISLFGINAEDSFVSAFCDKLSNYCSRNGNSLSEFLSHWNEKMREENVLVKKENGSLELQTIHKAKGLEYKVVIIPFCDWEFVDNRHSEWYLNPEKEAAVGVFASHLKAMREAGGEFDSLAQAEEALQKVDNLNLLYVALTRPKHCLSIISKDWKPAAKEKNDFPKTVSELMYSYLLEKGYEVKEAQYPEINGLFCEIGDKITGQESNENKQETPNPFSAKSQTLFPKDKTPFQFSKTAFALSKTAFDYWQGLSQIEQTKKEVSQTEKTQWGSLVHSVLSAIKKEEDLERALQKVESEEQRQKVREVISRMLDYSKDLHWWDGTFRVLNEHSISHKGENEKRPDRVMVSKDRVVVVDYKFVQSLDSLKQYEKQIEEYGYRLSQMGYDNISLYLWGVETLEEEKGELKQRLQKLDYLKLQAL